MAAGTRERMVQAATELFRERGYDGTGFRDVVRAAGTTNGVVYHHFPGGKAELALSVVDATGQRLMALVEKACADNPPREAVMGVLDVIEKNLVRGDLRPGCPITAVALASEDADGRLRAAGDVIFSRIRESLLACLLRAGIVEQDGERFATLAVAAGEGAVILCRARRSTTPLREVRTSLADQVDRLTRSAP